MKNRTILAAGWLSVLAMCTTAAAQVECAASGVATKLKVPMVRAHSPCGYQGREPDGTTAWGSSCSAPATVVHTTCYYSGQTCTSDSDCSEKACWGGHPGSLSKAPCDDQGDCSPCDYNGSNCYGYTCHSLTDLGAPPGSQDFCNVAVVIEDPYHTQYQYGPKGACTLSAKSKAVADCSKVEDSNGYPLNLDEVPCHVTYLSVRCSDVRRQDGTPVNGAVDTGFELQLKLRFTIDDGRTIVDLPRVIGGFSDPEDGSFELSTSTAEILAVMFNGGQLPRCTAVEIERAEILDPDENVFATMGLATH